MENKVSCSICGTKVRPEDYWQHHYECVGRAEQAAAQRARVEQTEATYYGYPKRDTDLLEVLISIRDTNPESIEHGYNRKES